MPKNTSQKLKIAARSKVRHGKSMPKRVRRKPNTSDTALLPEYLEIPFKVPNGDFCLVLCTKEYPRWLTNNPMPPQALPKFYRKGYKPLFTSLPHDLDGQIIEVYGLYRKS